MFKKKIVQLNTYTKPFKPEVFKMQFKYLDDGDMLNDNNSKEELAQKIKQKLKQKGLYKETLFYAGYKADKYKNLISTGVANKAYLPNVMVTYLYEPDFESINYENDALSYTVDELDRDDDILVAVYDLPHIDFENHHYIHEVPIDNNHPYKGLIAIFKIHVKFIDY